MNIRQIIAAFAEIEAGLAVTHPYPATIKRVYQYLPPSRNALDTPCIMHQYRPLDESRGPNGLRQRDFAVRIQLLAVQMPAETDIWSEIVASFDDQLITALDKAVLLKAKAHQRLYDFGSNEYQPSLLEWNAVPYLGSQYEYRVTTDDIIEFGIQEA